MDIYSLPTQPANLGGLGIFYLNFAATWTTLVLLGMIFLSIHRHNPIVRIRGLPLTLAAMSMLHAYWILGQIVVPVGPTIQVVLAYSIQYFFMGIWLPLGIALFHAVNLRFLHIARLQRMYVQPDTGSKPRGSKKASWLYHIKKMDYMTKILMFIGLGMIVQILLTVGMWLACRKYHPGFGVPGTGIANGTIPQQVVDLGRGWEWWPTLAWQFIWAWLVAPYLLLRSWNIKDTLGWRLQTVGCCISGLHATPMFLIASYVPAFAPINQYFTPSNWVDISLMLIEIFTIFVPCWEVLQYQALLKKAVESNSKWTPPLETPVVAGGSAATLKSSRTSISPENYCVRSELSSMDDDRLFTMTALDHVLRMNPEPLQDFSALRDFSGENIAFLSRVAEWKEAWLENKESGQNEAQASTLFTQALAIYTDLVSPRDAEFPINISSRQLDILEDVFERAARIICGEPSVNEVTPFDYDTKSETKCDDDSQLELGQLSNKIVYTGEIPAGFHADIFDEAYSQVKYLVFTNTWPKFVREIRAQRPNSSDTKRSDHTWSTNGTLIGRATEYIKSVF